MLVIGGLSSSPPLACSPVIGGPHAAGGFLAPLHFGQPCAQNGHTAHTFRAIRRQLDDISLWGLHSSQISLITS